MRAVALLGLLACAAVAQEPAVDGVSLGMPRAEVQARLSARPREVDTRARLRTADGLTVDFDIWGRASRITGGSLSVPTGWLGRRDFTVGSSYIELTSLVGRSLSTDNRGFELWQLPGGGTVGTSRGSEMHWDYGEYFVDSDRLDQFRLERWSVAGPRVTPGALAVNGLSLGVTRAEIDAQQQREGRIPHICDGGQVWYLGKETGAIENPNPGPSVWFDDHGLSRRVEGGALTLDGYSVHLGDPVAKVLTVLGEPAVTETCRDVLLYIYPRFQVAIRSGDVVSVTLGSEPR